MKQFNNCERDRVWTPGRASREHSVRTIIDGRRAKEFVALRAVEFPENKQVRETFDIGDPDFEINQYLQHTFGVVLGSTSFGDLRSGLVGSAGKSYRSGLKHVKHRNSLRGLVASSFSSHPRLGALS